MKSRPSHDGNEGHEGFSLLELVVIIAVIGILAAAVAPTVMNGILDTRIAATQDEAHALYDSMVGAPNSDGTRFGFVGDLPGTDLDAAGHDDNAVAALDGTAERLDFLGRIHRLHAKIAL